MDIIADMFENITVIDVDGKHTDTCQCRQCIKR